MEPDAAGDRLQEPVEGHHGRPEDQALGGQLPAVRLDVGRPRDDEQAAAPGAGALGVEGTARLRGVGGTGDEVQGHAGRDSVAHRAADLTCRRSSCRSARRDRGSATGIT